MTVFDLPDEAWLAIAAVIGWTILQSLKAMCVHLDHEIRLHSLTIEARNMRQSYVTRLHGTANQPAVGATRKINEFVSEVEIVEPDPPQTMRTAA